MSSFNEALRKYIDDSNASKTLLANAIGCSRTMVHNVINNNKGLSEESFLRLINNAPLSETQAEELRKEYFRDKYPTGVIEKIYSIRENLARRRDLSASTAAEFLTCKLPESNVEVNGEINLIKAIAGIINDSGCKKIITNYPYSATEIDDVVFALLRQKDEDFSFTHIVRYEDSNKTPKNINNIFSSLRYMRIGRIPYQYYSDDPKLDFSVLFPYFFFSDKGLLLFDLERQSAVFFREGELLQNTELAIVQMVKKCRPTGKINVGILEFKDGFSVISQRQTPIVFGNSPCFAAVANEEIISSVPRDDLPDRDLMVQIAINHYAMFYNQRPYMYIHINGIIDFAHVGIVSEIPPCWAKPLSFKHRKQLLEATKNLACATPSCLRLFDNATLGFDDPAFMIDIFDNAMIVYGSPVGGNNNNLYVITIENQSIVQDFNHFIDFFKRNELAFSEEYTANFFDDLLLECDRLQQNEEEGQPETKSAETVGVT